MNIVVHVTAESLSDLYRQLKTQIGELEGLVSVPGADAPAPAYADRVTYARQGDYMNSGGPSLDAAAGILDQAAAMLGTVQAAEAPAAEPEKPKRTRKAKEAAGPFASSDAPAADEPKTVETATAPEAPAATTAASTSGSSPANGSAAASSPATGDIVARWSEGGSAFEMTRDDVLNAARDWISSHKEGKDRASKLIKGMVASLGAGKVSDLPDSDMQAFIELLHGAA